MSTVSQAVHSEWESVVAAAVVGTDRRPPPAAEDGFDVWARSADPACALLDRAAAAVVARRAGARPSAAPVLGDRAPADLRPPCPPACAARLRRLLRGAHDELLPEWFARFAAAGWQLPWEQLPHLLQRGRRDPGFDQVVRDLAGDRARWLATALPELGVDLPRRPPRTAVEPLRPLAAPADSDAVVSAVVEACGTGAATWAAAPQLRLAVAALDPAALPALVAGLSRLPYQASVERTRAELLALAEFRHAMVLELTPQPVGAQAPPTAPHPAGTVTP